MLHVFGHRHIIPLAIFVEDGLTLVPYWYLVIPQLLHRFDLTDRTPIDPQLHDGVVWDLYGFDLYEGREKRGDDM